MQDATSERAVPLDLIRDNPYNSRRHYEESEIRSLAESILKVGLLNPVRVRRCESGFELVHGHRRVRAVRLLDRKAIQATIGSYSDEELLIVSLVENLERKDLSDYEKALSFRRMHDEFGKTEEDIGKLVGLSKGAISNYILMTRLIDEDTLSADAVLRKAMYSVSEHHARYLARIGDLEERAKMLKLVVAENLSVRDLQRMALRLRSWFVPTNVPSKGGVDGRQEGFEVDSGRAGDVREIRAILLAEFSLPKKGDFRSFADLHAFGDGFSIYSDFPPYRRITGAKAMEKERDWFQTVAPHLTARIRDIKTQIFGNTALATLYVDQRGKVKGRQVKNVLRGSVFFEKRSDRWKIIHEHWSGLGK